MKGLLMMFRSMGQYATIPDFAGLCGSVLGADESYLVLSTREYR